MNLLKKYLPNSSAHIESLYYSKEKKEFVIVFYDKPDTWKKHAKFTFSNITSYSCGILDEDDKNLIDLAIGFDSGQGGYCLHTDTKEIFINTSSVPIIEYIT